MGRGKSRAVGVFDCVGAGLGVLTGRTSPGREPGTLNRGGETSFFGRSGVGGGGRLRITYPKHLQGSKSLSNQCQVVQSEDDLRDAFLHCAECGALRGHSESILLTPIVTKADITVNKELFSLRSSMQIGFIIHLQISHWSGGRAHRC